MNLLLLEPGEVDGGVVDLRGRRARHVISVLGAGTGDRVRVGVARGATGSGVVEAIGGGRVRLRVELTDEPAAPPPVSVVLALPRPKSLSRALETAAQLGVRRIDLINAWRVDKSYFDSPRLEPAKLREALVLGCEQGATTWLPAVAVHRLFTPFVRGALAERVGGDSATGLLLHPRDAQPIERVLGDRAGEVILAIGPDGGWIDRELATFDDVGFRRATLGDRVLRTDVAVAAALAQLQLLRRFADPE